MVALTGKTRLRLPFDVLPGAVYLALLSLPALSEESGGSDGGTDLDWQRMAALPVRGGVGCTSRSQTAARQNWRASRCGSQDRCRPPGSRTGPTKRPPTRPSRCPGGSRHRRFLQSVTKDCRHRRDRAANRAPAECVPLRRSIPVRRRLGDSGDRPDCQRRLMIGRGCLLRCWCGSLWGRGFRSRRRRSGLRCWSRCRCRCRRSSFWGRCGRWSRRWWCGLRGWRRCGGFSLRRLDLGGLALVPVHEVGSNDESEHDASQDDSEERPTAGLVVVCHVLISTLERRWSRRGKPNE